MTFFHSLSIKYAYSFNSFQIISVKLNEHQRASELDFRRDYRKNDGLEENVTIFRTHGVLIFPLNFFLNACCIVSNTHKTVTFFINPT